MKVLGFILGLALLFGIGRSARADSYDLEVGQSLTAQCLPFGPSGVFPVPLAATCRWSYTGDCGLKLTPNEGATITVTGTSAGTCNLQVHYDLDTVHKSGGYMLVVGPPENPPTLGVSVVTDPVGPGWGGAAQ